MDVLFVEPSGSGQVRLGITTLASVLRNAGLSVKIADIIPNNPPSHMRSEAYFIEQLKSHPKVVAFTATTPTFHLCLEAIKKARPFAGKIIVGGAHATIFMEKILEKVPEVDAVTYGEAEEIVVGLVEALISGKGLENIKGVCYRENGKIKINPPTPLIMELDKIPFPSRDLLDIETYDSPFNVMGSRGCPYNCVYCSKPITGTVWRGRSPKNVVDEIADCFEKYPQTAKKLGRVVAMSDDNFTVDKKRAIGICDELINRKMDINMTCATGIHVNTVSKELLQKMKDAGCTELWFGMETGNEKILNSIGKATTLPKVREAVKTSKEIGIDCVAGHFIIGLPDETLKEARETVSFIKSLDLDMFGVNQAVPFPGTRLWDYVQHKAKMLVEYEDVVDYRAFLGYGRENPLFETKEFPKEDRKKAYLEAMAVLDWKLRKRILSPGNIKRFLSKVKSPQDIMWGIDRSLSLLTHHNIRYLKPKKKK